MSTFSISIRPKSSILAKYRDSSYKLEHALSEFIDNSTCSFFNNEETLSIIGQTCCTVVIEVLSDKIIITDNAFGMNRSDFERAIVLDSPPKDKSGRSEKGMGLKTAATWLGNLWSVKTTEYDSSIGYVASVDVSEIEEHAPETINGSTFPCDKKEHYTIITISNLRRNFTAKAVQKMKTTLAQMYAIDIKNNNLRLIINKEPVKYEEPEIWIDANTQLPYKKNFIVHVKYENKIYDAYGWAAIRKKGSTSNEGFSIVRRGRAIQINYKPRKLCGAPNSYSQQRLFGEIHLDQWNVSHTKDQIQWDGGLEDALLDSIRAEILDLIKTAETLRVKEDYESHEAVKKMAKQNEKDFKGCAEVDTTTVSNSVISQQPAVVEPLVDDVIEEENEGQPITVPFKDKKYTFIVQYKHSLDKDWISIEKTEETDKYSLYINIDSDFFTPFRAKNKVEFLQKLAITIATAFIVGKENGADSYYPILSALNNIIKAL